ncbi:MAG: carboxypeptidase regulatory-like domain-containing protein [Anaerolineae bacterium]|nr:carboxypeptidase regulatory-like domain-containing protein [Anaerolineae bacterium]
MSQRRRPVLVLALGLGVLLLLLQGGAVASLRAASEAPNSLRPQSPAQGSVSVCGRVIAYSPPIGIVAGSLTVGLETFLVNPGASITGEALLTPGNSVCINGTTNANGRIVSLTVTLAPADTPSPTSVLPTVELPLPTLTLPLPTLTLPPILDTPTPGPTSTPGPGVGTTINVCGIVNVYVPASAIASGSLSIGGQTLVLAPGTVLDGAALLRQGTDVCVELTVGLNGQVLSGRVTPNVGATVGVCGLVTDFQAATSTTPGSITIGGQTFPIAAGASLDNQNLIHVGSDLCLNAQLNAAGQISTGGVTLNAGGSVNLCGTVTAFQAATANAPGSITIGGQTLPIAAGAVLAGQDNIRTGNSYCLDGNLNAAGQVSGGTVSANVTGGATVSVCGVVAAFQAATVNTPGSITIGGQTFPIAAGTTLTGQEGITLGQNYCLSGGLNAQGQLQNGTISASAGGNVSLCGVVTAYSPASANQAGSVTIGGQTIPIAVGTTLVGNSLLTTGNNVCLDGQLNANGQLSNGTVTANASGGGSVQICGVLTAFQAATANAPGSITVGGQTFPIAAGTSLTGQDLLRLGSDVCLSGALNANGQINNGTVTANAVGSISMCGTVTAFTPASANTPGSITIGGQTIPIATGVTLAGQDQVRVDNTYCVSADLNAQGQIRDGTITAQVGGGSSVNICGVVTAFQAATANAAGSITIGGQTIVIAPGTVLTGQDVVNTGDNYCLQGGVDASGRITNGEITLNVTGRLCGVVDSITGSTITIDGRVITFAPNVDIGPSAGVCASVCVELDTLGRAVRVSANVEATVRGTVSAYSPGQSITVNGQTIPLAPNARVDGNIGVGSQVTISLNGAGQAVCVTGTPGGTGTPGAAASATATATCSPRTSGTPGPTPTRQPGTTNICGTVYDAVTRQPIPGARVEAFSVQGGSNFSMTAGPDGYYCFYNVPPGDYTVVGTHPNYNPDSRTVNAPPNTEVTVNLFLQPRPNTTATPAPTRTVTATPGASGPNTGTLCVYVTDQNTGNLIVGAVVEVFDATGRVIGTGVTGEDGRVCIPNLPPGPVSVLARVPDCPGVLRCASRLISATVVGGQAVRVDAPLECRGAEYYLPHIETGATWRPVRP